jgi:Heparinase II/III-like protein
MEAAALSTAAIPRFFAPDLREIAPSLNEDLLDLYGRSEQVLANHFAFFNHSEALAWDFDWQLGSSSGGRASAAWLSELHSFDYALDLAMTYRISQEERYAFHLRYLIAHWIAANPPGRTVGWEREPTARRVHNWILSAGLARDIWERDPQFVDLLSRSLALQCVFLKRRAARAASPESASQIARALRVAGRFFAGTGAGELAESGRALLNHAAQSALKVGQDSNCLRPSSLLAVAEACAENLAFAFNGADAPPDVDPETVRQVLSLLENSLMPDGTLPMFGPSARPCPDEISDLFTVAAVVLQVPRWKKLAGKFGIIPYLLLGERGKARFEELPEEAWRAETRATPQLGLYRLSSGRRSALMINGRPPSTAGDHQDFLSYELNLGGLRAIADSGSYSPPGEIRDNYFASARAHNVLLIDGHGPPPGKAKPAQASAVDGILGEGSGGICFQDESWRSLGIHRRRAFYPLGDNAWAVLDRLEGAGSHEILNLIHFYPTFQVEARKNRASVRSRAIILTLIPLSPSGAAGVTLKVSRGPQPDLAAYFSPDFGVKFEAAVLAIEEREAPLPWLGGYLLVAGTEVDFRLGGADPAAGCIEFELEGARHKLIAP